MSVWKLSAGTAGVIGLKNGRIDVLPTTAYIMVGDNCRNNCCFCAQSRKSRAKTNMLSRVIWPEFPATDAIAGIARAQQAGCLRRACLQVVDSGDSWTATLSALAEMKTGSSIPVCVSSQIRTVAEARELIAAGADRISLALDAATPEVYATAKDGDWLTKRNLLSECAKALPGLISTHLIVGLGETEQEMVDLIASLLAEDITVGLFAFTPVRGTAWGEHPAPPVGQYRRIQAAHYLLKSKCGKDVVQFFQGRIMGFNVPCLAMALAGGKAFETSGCPDCNRPYYNERPGGVMYNYPRPLTTGEFYQALAECDLKEGNYEMADG